MNAIKREAQYSFWRSETPPTEGRTQSRATLFATMVWHFLVRWLLAAEDNANGRRRRKGPLLIEAFDLCSLTGLAAVLIGQVTGIGTIHVQAALSVLGTDCQVVPAALHVTDRRCHATGENR